MTSRDISNDQWEEARRALVFYFGKWISVQEAEDLAQITIKRLWERADYEFSAKEDFLKVCFGFAALIRLEVYNQKKKRSTETLDQLPFPRASSPLLMNSEETKIYLGEILRIAKSNLKEKDHQALKSLIQAYETGFEEEVDPQSRNNRRVRLHRMRKRMQDLVGWKPTAL